MCFFIPLIFRQDLFATWMNSNYTSIFAVSSYQYSSFFYVLYCSSRKHLQRKLLWFVRRVFPDSNIPAFITASTFFWNNSPHHLRAVVFNGENRYAAINAGNRKPINIRGNRVSNFDYFSILNPNVNWIELLWPVWPNACWIVSTQSVPNNLI